MTTLASASAYTEFVKGRPDFEVEPCGEDCYLNRPTGCTFSSLEIEQLGEKSAEQ